MPEKTPKHAVTTYTDKKDTQTYPAWSTNQVLTINQKNY